MKMFETIPMFILLFTGYLHSAQLELSTTIPYKYYPETTDSFSVTRVGGSSSPPMVDGSSSPSMVGDKHNQNSTRSPAAGTRGSYPISGRSLPTLVVAGVSIALVLLFILIVAVSWYAWRKSQEGSIEINPIPYSEPGVSLRTISVPENQQEWPFEKAVQ